MEFEKIFRAAANIMYDHEGFDIQTGKKLVITGRDVDGCGGDSDYVSVKIKSEPEDALIYYIPLFDFNLCSIINMEPRNVDDCIGWKQNTGNIQYMLGRYYTMVKWPSDEKDKFSLIDIDSNVRDRDPKTPATIAKDILYSIIDLPQESGVLEITIRK